MTDTTDQHELKWGDSFDLLSDERKRELRELVIAALSENAPAMQHYSSHTMRLNGLDVFWMASCALERVAGHVVAARLSPATHYARLTRDFMGASVSLEDQMLSDAILRHAQLHRANLRGANLRHADLRAANLEEANLSGTILEEANLSDARLVRANFSNSYLGNAHLHGANLAGADLRGARLRGADLSETSLEGANLRDAILEGANFRGARLHRTDLNYANLSRANLSYAVLEEADLSGANLAEADVTSANMNRTRLVGVNFRAANLTDCSVYGVATWDLQLDGAIQNNLRITQLRDPEITVDDLEVAQFLYLMLHNEKIRNVIGTIAKKLVLILGRFTPGRKRVLDALRDELRRRNYLPVVFDFERSDNRDLTETISTLAHIARFVIADLTDAKSIPQELTIIVPNLPSVAIQPIILDDQSEYGMFEHWQRYNSVLDTYRYKTLDALLVGLADHVIAPAEQRANEIAPPKHLN